MIQSKLHFYSYGIVAKDKVRGEDIIYITPIEAVPFYDGDISADTEDVEHKGVDAAGNPYTVKVKRGNAIQATWLNFAGTHRATSPDVVHGERVLILQYADTGDFYWISLGQDDGLRSRETVIWYFSNLDDKGKTLNTPDNAYSIKYSTHDKEITLTTNKSDGEPFAYKLKLNTKDGKFSIEDSDGNFIFLDSSVQHIKLQNRNESMLELVGSVINMNANESINQTTKSWNVKSTDVNITATTGNFKIQTLGVNGSNYTVSSNVTFSGGTVTHGGKNIGKTHKHKVLGVGQDTAVPT
jgi:phage baseplate assembly protein gpV